MKDIVKFKDMRNALNLDKILGYSRVMSKPYVGDGYTIEPFNIYKEKTRLFITVAAQFPLIDTLEFCVGWKKEEDSIYIYPSPTEDNDHDFETLRDLLKNIDENEFFNICEKIVEDIVPKDYWDMVENIIEN